MNIKELIKKKKEKSNRNNNISKKHLEEFNN